MPYFVEQDLADVMADMQSEGYALQTEWFAPHFEFKFPKYGDFATRGMHLELRQALEPWHVMGEEAAAGGCAVRAPLIQRPELERQAALEQIG